jgi:hypothetical protein
MANNKFFPMSEDIQDLVAEVMKNDTPYLATLGLDFIYLGIVKQPTVIKVSKINPVTEYLTEKDDSIIITIYEQAFERLTPEYRRLVIAHALNSIEFDSETGKISIHGNNGTAIDEGIYTKYGEPSVLAVFSGDHAIKQIEREKKEDKKQK